MIRFFANSIFKWIYIAYWLIESPEKKTHAHTSYQKLLLPQIWTRQNKIYWLLVQGYSNSLSTCTSNLQFFWCICFFVGVKRMKILETRINPRYSIMNKILIIKFHYFKWQNWTCQLYNIIPIIIIIIINMVAMRKYKYNNNNKIEHSNL